ncbi:hypothetical protein [Paraburkholderia youngii]|uniref:hypothetical protein n=1 Tax=Paraburkholderia youngii TaxID=2782701 RepID=UPI003D262BDC
MSAALELQGLRALVTGGTGVIYRPATQVVDLLAEPPPAAFVNQLRNRGVTPLSVVT